MDDDELLRLWRSGDRKAGDRLFMRHCRALTRFFRGMARDDTEDLVHQTFVRALERNETIRGSFVAFMWGVAWNVMREHLRKLAKGRQVEPEHESMQALDPGPSTMVARNREERVMHEALRRIPAEHQAALQLYYWEGLKIREIAEILVVSPTTMRDRMVRARQLLRAAIREIEGTFGILPTSTP